MVVVLVITTSPRDDVIEKRRQGDAVGRSTVCNSRSFLKGQSACWPALFHHRLNRRYAFPAKSYGEKCFEFGI